MVSDKFFLFGMGQKNSNKLPGKSEWKIFNDTNRTDTSSPRPQDDWLHIRKNETKHSSYGSHASSTSSRSSIKIPTNNEFYSLHRQAYKLEKQANKENKTRFPTTTGFDHHANFNCRNDKNESRSRSKTTTAVHTSYKPSLTSSTTSKNKRTPLENYNSGDSEVVMDWVSNMDP